MKFKAIIFDMDGTIIDTEHAFVEAQNTLIARRGIKLTDDMRCEIAERTRGITLAVSVGIIKEITCLDEDLDVLIAEKRAIADEIYERESCLIDGFHAFHGHMNVNHQLKSAIATNADDTTLAIAKRKFELETYFGQHIYNVTHVNHKHKPNPALYLHAASQLEIDPIYCIAIEDSPAGIKAAKAAGMFCIGINTGKDRDKLHESDLIIEGYHEIDLKSLLHGE